ncbi:hypothetical protein Tco_0706456 [Tanacetum coccineum]|uniref:Uncharacterized protein n=1 Tax=Tanacetum coccineum TaxID=301880 RepID=A0ABQ4Y9F6_9ASTR
MTDVARVEVDEVESGARIELLGSNGLRRLFQLHKVVQKPLQNDNDIYSTVDACPNACEMWKLIESLKQGESINVQDLETNLYWEFGKFTLLDGESLELYYSRFVTLVKKSQELKTVSYHKLYDILKQHQNEVNELRAERLARTANLLALVSQQQPAYHPQNHPTHYTHNSSTRSQQAATRKRGKAIVKDAAYHKEKILLCKQEEAGFQLNAEQANLWDDTDDKPDDKELESHYMYMVHIQEVTPNVADNSGPIFDTEPLHKDDDDLSKERDLLASLIEKLKCEIDDSKNCNTFLESSNKTLIDKIKGEIEDFKTKNKSLESSNNHFKEAKNKLSKTNQLMFKDLKKFQAKLNRYHDMNYPSKVEIDCAIAKGDLVSYKMESQKSFNEYTRRINDLNQTILEMKKELFAHQETISIMSQEKETQKKFHKTREDKELEKVIALENKIKVLDDIVYKIGQSVQTMNMLNRNYKTIFVKPEFLKKAQRANPRLYDIGCYNDNLTLMLPPESDERFVLPKKVDQN